MALGKVSGAAAQKGVAGKRGPGRPKSISYKLWERRFDRQRFFSRLDEFLEMDDEQFVAECQKANQFDSAIIALLISIKRDQNVASISLLWKMLGYIKRGDAAWDRDAMPEQETHIQQAPAPVAVGEADLYIVEMNEGGKFVRARPRLSQFEGAATIDIKADK